MDRTDRHIGGRLDRGRHNGMLRDLGETVEIPQMDLPFAHGIARNPDLFDQYTLAPLLA